MRCVKVCEWRECQRVSEYIQYMYVIEMGVGECERVRDVRTGREGRDGRIVCTC